MENQLSRRGLLGKTTGLNRTHNYFSMLGVSQDLMSFYGVKRDLLLLFVSWAITVVPFQPPGNAEELDFFQKMIPISLTAMHF